jgi:hydroxypyruvate isomerase
MIRLSANLGFLWKGLPLEEAVRRAKAAGFDAVEFHAPYAVPAETMRALLRDLALPVAGINTRSGDVASGEFGIAAAPGREAEARAAIDEALAYAATIGARYVQVTAGRAAEAERGRARETLLRSLDYASRSAEPRGITIVIEPLNPFDMRGAFLTGTKQAADIIAELARPNVKILFDCYHMQIMEGNLTRRLETLMPIIGHIQIAAVPTRAEPDTGEIAYDRLLNAIDAMGYEGVIGAEYRPRGEVEAGLGWMRTLRGAV